MFIKNNSAPTNTHENSTNGVKSIKTLDTIYNQRNHVYHEEDEDEDEDEYYEEDDEELENDEYNEELDSDQDDSSYYDTSDEEDEDGRLGQLFNRRANGAMLDSSSLNTNKTARLNANDIENLSISSANSKKSSLTNNNSNQLNINNNNNTNLSNLSLNNNNDEGSQHQQRQPNSSGPQSFTSPITPFFGTKMMSFMRRMENSIETSSSKLKGVSKVLMDKTEYIKEVIMSNTNGQDITSRLKSMSNYNIGSPQQYINGLVKSNTNLNEFNGGPASANRYASANGNNLTPAESVSSQTSLDNNNLNSSAGYLAASMDLEPIANDDTFKPLSIKWWCLDKTEDYLNFIDFCLEEKNGDLNGCLKRLNEALIDVQMTSCNL